MSEQWIVTLDEQQHSYGPFDDRETANRFADFLTAEVDPATVHRLYSPVVSLLGWRDLVERLAPTEDTIELPSHGNPAGPVDGGEGT